MLVVPDYAADEIEYDKEELHKYEDSTYKIISKVAYLIGVPKHIFENEKQSPKSACNAYKHDNIPIIQNHAG